MTPYRKRWYHDQVLQNSMGPNDAQFDDTRVNDGRLAESPPAPQAKARPQRPSARTPTYASRFERRGEEGQLLRFVYHSPDEGKEYTLWVRELTAIGCECWQHRRRPGPCKHQIALTRLVNYVRKVQEAWQDNLDLLEDAWD